MFQKNDIWNLKFNLNIYFPKYVNIHGILRNSFKYRCHFTLEIFNNNSTTNVFDEKIVLLFVVIRNTFFTKLDFLLSFFLSL